MKGCPFSEEFWKNHIEVINKVFLGAGTFVAILSVTSYNLRCRSLDYSLRHMVESTRPEDMSRNARKTGECLTNMVLLSFISSLIIFISGNVKSMGVAQYLFPIAVFLFLLSVMQYIYVIFAFEKLEKFVLGETEKKAVQEEIKRQLQPARNADSSRLPPAAG